MTLASHHDEQLRRLTGRLAHNVVLVGLAIVVAMVGQGLLLVSVLMECP
jgi:hypothetical protein